MTRRMARETALQVLYQIDITREAGDLDKILNHWAKEFSVSDKSVKFARQLIEGTLENKKVIDERIAKTAHEWALDRMSAVDRNLMRLAVYEMMFCPNTPQRVTINEAIEIAKKFGGEHSARFINGILDKLMDVEEKLPDNSPGEKENQLEI